MKTRSLAAFATLALAAAAHAQVTYTDAQNDIFNNDFAHLDITSVTVSHDDTNITFAINVRGDIDATAWGKYCIGIDTGAPGGSPGNGWGRPVDWNGQGIDWFIGTWADDGGNNFGGEVRDTAHFVPEPPNYATWLNNFPGAGSSTGFTQLITVTRASIGLTGDQAFRFDVFSSGGGGGDPGVDHLSRADLATTDWSVPSVAGEFRTYVIPAPGAGALLAMTGLLLTRRRR